MVVDIVVAVALVAIDKTCWRALSESLGLQPSHQVVGKSSLLDHAQRQVQHDVVRAVFLAPGNDAFYGLVRRREGHGEVAVATALQLTMESSLCMSGLHVCRDGMW